VKEEIKGIKPPIRLFDYIFLVYLLIGVLIISLLIYYFIYRKYFKKKKEEIVFKKEEKLLSHQLALKKLDELDKEQLWQKGFVKDYHSRITDIIREYFEKQFGLPALERTTTESLNLLSKHALGVKVLDLTTQFFNNADLVKFAKYTPLEIVNHEMMTQAKHIVKRTAQLDIEEESKNVNEEANV
jgi:REP element-mobilizing transposase RayT